MLLQSYNKCKTNIEQSQITPRKLSLTGRMKVWINSRYFICSISCCSHCWVLLLIWCIYHSLHIRHGLVHCSLSWKQEAWPLFPILLWPVTQSLPKSLQAFMPYLSGQEGSESVAQHKTFQKLSDGKHCIKPKCYCQEKNACTLNKTHKPSHHPCNHKFLVGFFLVLLVVVLL